MNRMIRRLSLLAFLAAASLVFAGVASAQTASHHKQLVHHVKLVVKSDEQRAKKGLDGKWHDAFLPANFKINAGAKVIVTVRNYDDMPHTFTAAGLHVNGFFMMGMAGRPSRTTVSSSLMPISAPPSPSAATGSRWGWARAAPTAEASPSPTD